MFGHTFKTSLYFLILAEILSIFAFLLPDFNQAAFLIISLLFIAISIIDLRLSLYIVLAELFVGSMGYIFTFSYNGLIIPIRISFWLIIMSVWLAHKLPQLTNIRKDLSKYKNTLLPFFGILFIFVIFGLLNAVFRGNSFSNIFFDINAWLYLFLVLPFYDEFVIKNNTNSKETLNNILGILTAGVVWLSLKTLILFYIFSHDIVTLNYYSYHWLRSFRLGEVTKMPSGFFRIFSQSQIFILLSFFIYIWKLSQRKTFFWFRKKGDIILFILSAVCLSVILISFSRSFWAGLIFGLFTYAVIVISTNAKKARLLFANTINLILIFFLSLLIIAAIFKFPWPKQDSQFATSIVLVDRAKQISDDAAASSRWNLLPLLNKNILKKPILGQGFGATITYTSNDPRVREAQINGQYTTYAFEWGWLDIWLKIGLFGLLAYAWLLFSIIKKIYKMKNSPKYSNIIPWGIAIVVLSVVSFFSPYLNHPLGFAFVILASTIIDFTNKPSNQGVLP